MNPNLLSDESLRTIDPALPRADENGARREDKVLVEINQAMRSCQNQISPNDRTGAKASKEKKRPFCSTKDKQTHKNPLPLLVDGQADMPDDGSRSVSFGAPNDSLFFHGPTLTE